MKVSKIIEKLQDMNPDTEIVSIVWYVDDVIECSKQHKIEITQEQAEQVLRLCDSEHDAEIGINWDVIACHIQSVKKK